ncbi:calcium-translocating P-type ATPase, PMCA-type [uncultured Methanobrevibacter sp.]|uniref:calcium-translocating P-type ATPase, PMCA-type n=1 Tax=uncultured Methanobrevibacter sp. TaxID=253161 RepID=UPI0026286BE7|nr:calcium-translocating P-type ATPase, PMCA-type [uncultured Methanobrevibacter sp.]
MENLLKKYHTSKEGLNSDEVLKRQKQNGLNELKEKKKKSPVILFLEQFIDVLIGLLIVAAIAAYFVGDVIDSCVILIAVLLNTIIGFIQEYRSEKAIEMLKSITTSHAVVKRNGEVQKIDSKELTIGDIVLLEEGDKVPADLILIETNRLKIDESNLTGESLPVEKSSKEEAYMDSNVTLGNGIGIVTSIGMNTSIGKIAEVIQKEKGETPLQEKMDKLGKTLSVIAIIVCIFIFIFELFKGVPIVETFLTAVSLAVAAIPEGLPAVLTLTLALGMQQLTKSNAIVRRLLSVETLGSCTVICSDKTGTLTENKMTVRDTFFYNETKSLKINAMCNNSTIRNDKIIGDPTDGAVLKYSQDHDYFKQNLEKKYPRINEIPLDSSRKMMTTIHEKDENYLVLSKGAPEIIIDKCKYIDNNGTIEIIDDSIKETLSKKIDEMTNNALRVLGIGYKNTENIDKNIENDLIFTGLVGIIDPPKENVDKSITACKKAGIKVIMITGDHLKTASAIAHEIGILTNGKIIDGNQLDKLSDEEYFEIVDDIQVYARVKPEQKMRIVETLKQKGEIVSMTGDGVNDAPALKNASIGVAMGSGTDVAKESGDMIIQDDNFGTIVTAIREGRKIYDNIKRFIKFQVSTNVGAILTIIGTSIFMLPVPFNPVQLLWINIVMDGPPAQTLGMEDYEKNIMNREPETGDILNKKVLIKIFVAGLVMAIGSIALFSYKLTIGASQKQAMTVTFTLFVIYQLFNAYNSKSNSAKRSTYLYLAIIICFILQVLIVYIPELQTIFRTTSIGIIDWILIFIIAATILISNKIMDKLVVE